MMFPRVTGKRFFKRKVFQVKWVRSRFIEATNGASNTFRSNPNGMMYMLATLCSNPAAIKKVIGKIITRILSVVECAL